MAILSKRTMTEVSRTYQSTYGLTVYFMDLSGQVINSDDPLGGLSNTRRRRDYALQQSISTGEPYVFHPAPSITTWVAGLEDRRMVHGAVISGEVYQENGDAIRMTAPETHAARAIEYLVQHGMTDEAARTLVTRLPVWPEWRVKEAATFLCEVFYQISGWNPVLTKENQLRTLQQKQITQAIQDQRQHGQEALYAFEKERALLANIRAGDRNGARSILNEMLATIYMSSPQLVVLRARTVELISCLTRAAIEDNPLLEPLIERNHAWTERLIAAETFERLSQCLMSALDEFIDGVYLHGMNRSNTKVHKALDFISGNYSGRISLEDIANVVALSPCRLSHLVKEFTGRTVLQHVQQVRIRHAQLLLEKTSKSCTEIAYEVGYGDQSHFIKHFRRLTGTTPGRFRRRQAPAGE